MVVFLSRVAYGSANPYGSSSAETVRPIAHTWLCCMAWPMSFRSLSLQPLVGTQACKRAQIRTCFLTYSEPARRSWEPPASPIQPRQPGLSSDWPLTVLTQVRTHVRTHVCMHMSVGMPVHTAGSALYACVAAPDRSLRRGTRLSPFQPGLDMII